MNKEVHYIFLCIVGFACFLSCSKDFKVAAPYKNITVVNGLFTIGNLDLISDSVQYIRIQKAFLDETRNAFVMAQIPDSSYYPEDQLDVSIREYQGTVLVSSTVLPRVDLRAEGYTKDDGTFVTGPNYAYKYKHPLQTGGDYSYELVIRNKVTGEVDSARAGVIANDYSVTDRFTYKKPLDFASQKSYNIDYKWIAEHAANAVLYEGYIRFRWIEVNAVTKDTISRQSADWQFSSVKVTPADLAVTLSVKEKIFFPTISNILKPPANANINRYLGPCTLYIWAGDSTMAHYEQYLFAKNGITGEQVRLVYSNLHCNMPGVHPVGIFAARSVKVNDHINIDVNSFDSLKVDPATKDLNIRGGYY